MADTKFLLVRIIELLNQLLSSNVRFWGTFQAKSGEVLKGLMNTWCISILYFGVVIESILLFHEGNVPQYILWATPVFVYPIKTFSILALFSVLSSSACGLVLHSS